MKLKYKLLVGATCLLVSAGGAYAGHAFITADEDDESDDVIAVYTITEDEDIEVLEEDEIAIERVRLDTRITLNHFDQTTGTRTSNQQTAPIFMLNKTQEQIVSAFSQWRVVSFSEQEVILERTIVSLPEVLYTIAVEDDVIVIYQGIRSDGNIIIRTNTTINHLSEEEKQMLVQGMQIFNEDELIRRLEDFMS